MGWISAVIIFAIFAGMIYMIVSRGRTMMRLAKRGTPIQGTVTKKARRQSSQGGMATPYLKYEFRARGQVYQRSIAVSEEVFNAHEEGGPIDISYDQQNPKINAAQYMVDLIKEAYAKKRSKE